MTPQEKSMIDSVFDRIAQGATGTKDAEAMAVIEDRVARQPNSVYGLVQAVLIQEMALNQAGARVAELERQLAQSGQSQGSSFLGGVGPWGRAAAPVAAPAPAQPQPQPQYQAQPAAGPWGPTMQPAGGGFLRNVAGMAAGVAAGSLLADGIASLFGGHHMFGGGYGGIGGGMGPWGGSPGMVENVENITVNNYGGPDGAGAVPPDGSLTDGGNYRDASFDPSGIDDSSLSDDGGSFDGGGFDSSDV